MGRKKLEDFNSMRGDDIERITHRLLSSHFWLRELWHSKRYTRLHDDHDGTYAGQLTVVFGEDGDAWVEIAGRANITEGLRFRVPMMGGGMSPRTRTALLILAEAIRLDNKERPQRIPQLCEYCKEGQGTLAIVNGKIGHAECHREAARELELTTTSEY